MALKSRDSANRKFEKITIINKCEPAPAQAHSVQLDTLATSPDGSGAHFLFDEAATLVRL
ncbi:hypothetical protein EYF80_037610 [Liparis tanakae]|uniref:Uncharacterized protein n=1 Tax=Liparis tanakae TaxID=230148 RepID=A0A4Z2GFW5_9TELE|nr:hypothetical protein EYF80_037610 [Liparis tanakae]